MLQTDDMGYGVHTKAKGVGFGVERGGAQHQTLGFCPKTLARFRTTPYPLAFVSTPAHCVLILLTGLLANKVGGARVHKTKLLFTRSQSPSPVPPHPYGYGPRADLSARSALRPCAVSIRFASALAFP